MKKNVLICSIMRNCEKSIHRYYEQIKTTVLAIPEINFSISIYENDSIDQTPDILSSLDWSFTEKIHIKSEKIKTQFYGSIKDEDRVKNLSEARNKSIYGSDFLKESDYVLFVESDIVYTPNDVKELIFFKDRYKIDNFDIVSAISLHQTNGKLKLYDAWGTRRFAEEEIGKLYSKWDKRTFDRYYATFNCLCLYNSVPFKNNIKFHWYNDRLKKFDNDTMVLCENFHTHGYNDIFINYKSRCYHENKK
jgi:hypothetical protein